MKNTFLLYDTDPVSKVRQALLFTGPVEIISCGHKDKIAECLESLDKAVRGGYYAAGLLSYELGLYFQDIPFEKRSDFPFFLFGIFSSCKKITQEELEKLFSGPDSRNRFEVGNRSYSVDPDTYTNDIRQIKEHIKAGNTYQVNYTFKHRFDFRGSVEGLFKHLKAAQDVPYAGLIDTDRWSVLSLSPELFFRKTGDDIIVRPMKGTSKRGKSVEEDALNIKNLARSSKNRAENIMIVDLLRNDLGRIAETGSVRPESLFDVEKYRTVLQMTSTVRARLKKGLSWSEIFENIFPSGSVTGAPKKRTMEIIAQTEKDSRDIYTGSMGYITPGGDAQFNVAIRTVLIDKLEGKGAMGIGSGIVNDSVAEKEYDESLLKGAFLTNTELPSDFALIETMLWENSGYFLLDLHMKRLEKSAFYFSYPFDIKNVMEALNNASLSFGPDKKYRVRLLLKNTGKCELSSSILPHRGKDPAKIAVSNKRTDKGDVFFYHKTTNRRLYDSEYSEYSAKGFFDVIFLNKEDEITEGAISNIMIKKDENYLTPPLSCGLLGGVCREHLLKEKDVPVKEKVLYLKDLLDADEIFLMNSVRKIVPAELRP